MKQLFLGTWIFLVFSLLFVQFILGPVINKVAKIHLHDSITEYNRQLARGAFHMMQVDLLRLPADEWQDRIAQLQPEFGYQIALFALDELTLTKEQMDQLRNGTITIVDDGELIYQRIGESNMALRKGPFSGLEPDTGYFNLVIWVAIIIIIGLLTFICIIPYWRLLRKMSRAALAFGNGEFNTRMEISKFSNLSPLAHAFNTMAERIGQLISSHKELTNAVSHELRTPLSRLKFGLEMIETAGDREIRSFYARGLQTDVAELEELVNELLTYARFDREKPELEFDVHNLESFLQQVIAETLPDDSPIRCHLLCRLDKESSQVRFEPKYLARAVGNLLQNAMNHAETEIQVIVERSGEDCSIHVDDDGPGIPEPDRLRIFEPFTRLDASRSRTSGGYGLGLAIVMRIIKWHNGQATAGEGPSGGARLTVRWPGFAG